MAAEVFEIEAFMSVSDGVYNAAAEALKKCNRVINAGVCIGESNRKIADLLVLAEDLGIPENI